MSYPLKVAQKIEHEQDNEDKAKSAAAADMTSVSIATTAEKKNQDNNEED